METTAAPKIVGPKDAQDGFLGSIGVRWMIDGDEAGSASRSSSTRCRRRRLPLRSTGTRARTSTATCSRAGWARCWATTSSRPGPGDLVHKPRNQWHTFWNAGDEPCRILEIISPAGFEEFFRELDPWAARSRPTPRSSRP